MAGINSEVCDEFEFIACKDNQNTHKDEKVSYSTEFYTGILAGITGASYLGYTVYQYANCPTEENLKVVTCAICKTTGGNACFDPNCDHSHHHH